MCIFDSKSLWLDKILGFLKKLVLPFRFKRFSMAEGLKENVLSFNELQEDIIKAYNDRILPGFVCPSCKTNSGVILLDGFISPVLQSTFGGNIALSGKVVPQVGFVCKHCGNIQYYAYKALVSNGNENVG